MATKINIHWDEVWPVYFVETTGLMDGVDLILEESEIADILAVQDNFWALQTKLAEMVGHDAD